MKLELATHLERGYVANTFRARAIRQRRIASERSKASIRAELEQEADYLEALAQRLDDGEEQNAVSEREPIKVDSRRDIDAIDAPETKQNGGS